MSTKNPSPQWEKFVAWVKENYPVIIVITAILSLIFTIIIAVRR